MLTESEREWLEHRDAMQFLMGTYIADFAEFPLWNNGKDWKDAAEFSERCAVWLAKRCAAIEKAVQQLLWAAEYKDLDDAAEILLECARLTVEEEMDATRL